MKKKYIVICTHRSSTGLYESHDIVKEDDLWRWNNLENKTIYELASGKPLTNKQKTKLAS